MNRSRHHSAHRRTARLGRWLPSDPKHLNEWLKKAVDAAESKKAPFHPVVEELREEIENDPELYMYFTQMFEQHRRSLCLPAVATSNCRTISRCWW